MGEQNVDLANIQSLCSGGAGDRGNLGPYARKASCCILSIVLASTLSLPAPALAADNDAQTSPTAVADESADVDAGDESAQQDDSSEQEESDAADGIADSLSADVLSVRDAALQKVGALASSLTRAEAILTADSTDSTPVINDGESIVESCTIESGGTYSLVDAAQLGTAAITVTVDTTDEVRIVGLGYDPAGGESAPTANNVQFISKQAGANLIMENVYLSTSAGLSLIDLTGEGNTVAFEGVNCLHSLSTGSNSGAAAIHVGKDCSANIVGTGTLYLFCALPAACIGANAGEANGTLSFGVEGDVNSNNLTLFGINRAKDSNGAPKSSTGPIIGSSLTTTDTPGPITFYSGTYYLSRSNDGGAIQGPSGTTSAEASVILSGANVYVVQNIQSNDIAQSGWSHTIGTASEVTGDDRGTFIYHSGSLLTYVTTLGGYSGRLGYDDKAYLPGITDAVLNLRRQKESGQQVMPCYVDTAGLNCAGSEEFYVSLDDEPDPLFSGALPAYTIEETPVYPSLTWQEHTQTMLCFYLTPVSHTLTINGEEVAVTWNSETSSFDVALPNQVVYTYKIGYNLSGGSNSASNPTEYASDTTGIVLEEPTRDGYRFTGWTDLSGNATTGISAGTTGYQEFTANWVVDSCAITYTDTEGIAQTITANYGASIVVDGTVTGKVTGDCTLPDDPAAGYARRLYTLVSATSDKLVFTSASVDLLTYAITYDMAGGTNNPENVSSFTVESADIMLLDPTKEGSSFDGWTLDGRVVTSIPAGSTGDKTLVATWTENTLSVSYTDATGAQASILVAAGRTVYIDGVASGTVSDGMSVPDPAAREGWSIAGYEATLDTRGNLLLTSTYAGATGYAITYDLDGGQASGTYPTYYSVDADDIVLGNPTRSGYAFAGFVDAQGNALSVRAADGTLSTTIASGTTGALYFKATWTTDYKTVRYLATDGVERTSVLPVGSIYTQARFIGIDGTTTTLDISSYAGENVLSVPAPTSVKAGYGIVAYELTANAVTGMLTFTEVPCMPQTYTITYDLAGGAGAEGNPATYTIETPTIELAIPTRVGYDFAGWRTASGTIVSAIECGTTGDLSLTAVWTAQPCAVSYLSPLGEEETIEIPYDGTYTIDGGAAVVVTGAVRIPDPTGTPDEGYLCVGYAVSVDAQGNAAFVSKSGKPVTCTVTIEDPLDKLRVTSDGAYYRKGSITATVNGTPLESGTTVPNGTVVDLTIYPLDGYVFDYFTVNGENVGTTAYQVTIIDNAVISAELHDANTRVCTASITDETNGKVSYTITKTGIVYKDGKPEWVIDKEVKDGDPLYEEDVLTLTATLADGAAPDDPDMTYLDENGALSPCRFEVNGRTPALESPGKYKVSAAELSFITDGKLSIKVLCPEESQKNWLQLADTSWFDASNPQSSYSLSTSEQLAGVVRLLNDGTTQFTETTISLARDISLANDDGTTGRRLWIASDYDGTTVNLGKAFKGTFDGKGHTISGIDISVKETMGRGYNGLFSAAYDATFKDLVLEGTVDTITPNAGALVAFASDCTIENVVNRATVRGCTEFGGIVGILTGTGAPKISSCRNEGLIEYGYNAQNSGGSCGGIVANVNEMSVIEDCVNVGAISSNVNDGFAGGIVGHAGGSETKVAHMSITNCRNYGAVTVRTNDGSSSASHIGGIVGFGPCTITQCANYGEVANVSTSTTQTAEVGGIIGAPTGSTVIKYCMNSGNVSLKAGAVVRIGGIAGWYDGGGTVMYCANKGTVDAGDALVAKTIPAEYASASGAGGLVGMASENGTDLFYSYNAGTVIGDSPAQTPLTGSAIGLAYGTIRLPGVLYLQGTAASSYGSLTGDGALSGTDAQEVTSSVLAASASTLNQGTDTAAFIDDVIGANGDCPILSWMATRTVTFANDNGATLTTVAVPESYAATTSAVASRYEQRFGVPSATTMPEGCTEATFDHWDNMTAGQASGSFDAVDGNVILRAVYAYDNDTYSIVYHSEDGTWYTGANPATYRSSEGVASFDALYGNAGEFVCWADESGETVDSIAVGETGCKDLYAVWDLYVSSDDLDGEIQYARQLLNAHVLSVDGTDVVQTRYWATAAQRAALEAQIASAREVADYPFLTQSASDQAIAELSAAAATYEAQLQPGTWRCAIIQQPADCAVVSGALAAFEVATNDSDAVKSYEWQYSSDGENWNNAKNYVKSDGSGFATAKLSFKMFDAYNGQKWRCKVTFNDGTVEYSNVATSTMTVPSTDPTPSPSSKKESTQPVVVEDASLASSSASSGGSASMAVQDSQASSTQSSSQSTANTAQNTQKQTTEEDADELLSGYADAARAVASKKIFGLSLMAWLCIIAAAALVIGAVRTTRQSHKYDKRLQEWM